MQPLWVQPRARGWAVQAVTAALVFLGQGAGEAEVAGASFLREASFVGGELGLGGAGAAGGAAGGGDDQRRILAGLKDPADFHMAGDWMGAVQDSDPAGG
ncbi:hypothetical protein T484DRAFT_1817937 [Baffinella frigidus]|nr:hypothetical protein T484DRAFT_1817937 [Cryptophyta sp. CCMP2293]